MIKVRILGSGLIPRGYGLAPRKEPLEIDWSFLNILLNNGNFKVQALIPDKKEFVDITIGNAKKMYELLSKKKPIVLPPVAVKEETKKEEVKVEPIKVQEIVEVKEEVAPVEEVKVEEVLKTVEDERQYFDKRNKFDKKKNKYRHQEEALDSKEE